MPNAKLEFSIGNISFSGEGEEGWLASQLDKIINKVPELCKVEIPSIPAGNQATNNPGQEEIGNLTLASFLKQKDATKNQNNKFLATAIWLHAKGKKRLKTAEITSALKDSNQSRLGNPSDALASNVAKGYCERDGKEFFVTDQGKASVG